jgi:HD superfamily phosphohydrolase
VTLSPIKDSIHDHIEVDGVAEALLDCREVQRLRRIRQLGTVELVYPSANHTRFEHSLGVYHIADRALEELGIGGRQAERVRAAALLHDVGHGPYSHNLEGLIHRRTGRYHDEVGDLLTAGRLAALLEGHGLDPRRVADLVAGGGRLGQLVSGELDVDRMDYLVRDAHHTGVPYGTIDHGRLVRELRFIDGELVLAAGNVQTAESLLLARALMNPTVYHHHAARAAKAMLRRATERLLDDAGVDADALRRWDDHDLIANLRDSDASAAAVDRLDRRDLFKRAVWAELDDVPADLIDADHESIRAFEHDIAADAGVDPEHVILDVPDRPSMAESDSRVVVGGEVRRLDEQSGLVRTLLDAQRDQWRLGVYAPADVRERVGHAAERTIGLDLDTLVTDASRSRGRVTRLDEFSGE